MSGAKKSTFSQGNVCALYLIFQGYLDIAFIPHGHNVKGNNKNILQRSAFVAKVQRGKYLLGLVANWDPSSILLLDITITITITITVNITKYSNNGLHVMVVIVSDILSLHISLVDQK